jgi:hypothetical protein
MIVMIMVMAMMMMITMMMITMMMITIFSLVPIWIELVTLLAQRTMGNIDRMFDLALESPADLVM